MAGFLYGFMYWAAVTDTEFGRKKRDGYSTGDDGFHGQVGESDGKLHHDKWGVSKPFKLTHCLAMEQVFAVAFLGPSP